MVGVDDIVITGLGCVSPIGIGRAAFEEGLLQGRCAVRKRYVLDNEERTAFYTAEVEDFAGKLYVKPRKALKVMSREVQTAYSAASLAWADAGLEGREDLDVDRIAVLYGSEMLPGDHMDLASAIMSCVEDGEVNFSAYGTGFKQVYPLWMLKNLPNMPACHVGIALDARGPNNTIAQEEVSGLLALNEAVSIMNRDQADIAVVGAVGGRVSATRLAYHPRGLYDQHADCPEEDGVGRCRPFGVGRHGIVASEGAATLVLERRSHAVNRGANILARVAGVASRCSEPAADYRGSRRAVMLAAEAALGAATVDACDLSHVNAQGYAEQYLDVEEGQGICDTVGSVPVTAFSSYFGTTGAGCGLLELAASLIGLKHGKVLPTLGTEAVDEACGVTLCREAVPANQPHFLKVSLTPFGHAAAAVIESEF